MSQGINAVGDFRVESGLGQAAARLVASMAMTGVPVSVQHADQHVDEASAARGSQLKGLPLGRRHAVDLWCLNINEFVDVPMSSLRPPGVEYTIAMWAWESASLPDVFQRQFDKVDEVWVPSAYSQRCLSRYTDKPVVVIPNVVPVPAAAPGRVMQEPGDGFHVLYTFDAWSSLNRKNPLAVLAAVDRAASRDSVFAERVQLTVKAKHLDSEPGFRDVLRARAAELGATLLEGNIPRSEMDSLLARTDVFLSLHRAEGFGLGLAEAMAQGKTVIATGWSGNVDFMDPSNSIMVGHAATRIGTEESSTFSGDDHWAEPDVDRAADALLAASRSPQMRASLGRAARQTILDRFSPEVVGPLGACRLDAVGATLRRAS